MSPGYFFKSLTHSQDSDGVIDIFRYRPVRILYQYKRGEDVLDWPIYVTLSEREVTFEVGYNTKEQVDEQVSDNELIKTKLFSIPLGNHTSTRLSTDEILLKIKTKKLHYKFQNYKIEDDKVRGFPAGDFYNNLKKLKKIDYFQDSRNKQKIKQFVQLRESAGESVLIYYEGLLLDFLFDIHHSDVFKSGKHYGKLIDNLNSTKILSALSLKAEFYYELKQYKKNKKDKNVKLFLEDKLTDSRSDWVDFLLENSEDDKIIEAASTNSWFNFPEREVKDALFAYDRLDTVHFESGIYQRASNWFIKRYSFYNAIRMVGRSYFGNFKDYHLLIPVFIFLLLIAGIYFPTHDMMPSSEMSLVKFLVSTTMAFGLFGILLMILMVLVFPWMHSKRKKRRRWISNINILFPRIQMATFSGWLMFISAEEFWRMNLDFSPKTASLYAILLLFLTTIYLIVEIRKVAPSMDYWDVIRRTLFVLTVAMALSVNFGMIGSSLLGKKYIERNKLLFDPDIVQCDTTLSLVADTFAIKQKKVAEIQDTFSALFVENELLKNLLKSYSDSSSTSQRFATSLRNDSIKLARVKIELHNESDSLKKYKNKYTKTENVLKLLDMNAKNRLYDSKLPIMMRMKIGFFEIYIFPGLLILYGAIAVFIGVFINLLFEEKTVTENI